MDPVMSDRGAASEGRAVALEAAGSSPARLGDEAAVLSALWTELISGFCKVEQVTFTAQSCALLVTRKHRAAEQSTAALPARDVEILERALTEATVLDDQVGRILGLLARV